VCWQAQGVDGSGRLAFAGGGDALEGGVFGLVHKES